ncbi:hypothetical protein RJ640_025893 [Escallonia rubra]|uniref:non-specific serine/threonine protein kinase n=1 Tax=Escallonia rubra TaxID=112253 RepID=A0AA88S2I7_9ASTE|nr:hypothetical protein RJ640_025893 [Escallonia rubra]
MLFLVRLAIFAFPFFFLHYLVFISASDLQTPSCPVDDVVVSGSRCFDSDLASLNPMSRPKLQKSRLVSASKGSQIANGAIFLILLLNIIVYYLRKLHESNNVEKDKASSLPSGQLCRLFSLAEVQLATHDFDDALIIGKGGFGKVYRGLIDNGKTTVAIKRLNSTSQQGAPEFWTEIQMLSKFRHGHLVSLIGYCNQDHEMILVYEYMPLGTFADHLHKVGKTGNPSLSWVQRLKICIGAARGLDYLHTCTGSPQGVIHRDVKSSNILLDENWAAKISDFGLSKIGPVDQSCTHVSTDVKGTRGYLDPEYYLTRRLTTKSDVYAFGVVLLEALCGRPAGQILPNSWKAFVQIAEQCLHNRPKQRPKMAEVVMWLEFALALQENANSTKRGGAYDNQENADSSTEVEHTDSSSHHNVKIDEISRSGNASDRQSRRKPSKMTLIGRVRRFLLGSSRVIPGSSRVIPAEEDLEDFPGQTRRFYLRELQVATNNFSNFNIVGRGGFGKVYKGRLSDGSSVAVKRVITDRVGALMFRKHVEIISMALHPNIVPLIGYGMTQTERFLVYPYMANGSVASCLRERPESQPPLDWPIRKRIALGSARALAYLHDHCNPKIIHRDVKAANILLDEEFEAFVGDFGLAKLMDHKDTHVTTAVRGTIGHIAPEYLSTGKASEKTDVFGYGVMLLELITGQRAFDLARLANDDDVMLLDWVIGTLKEKKLETLVDEDLEGNYIDEEVEQLIQVALLCTQGSPRERPKMSVVVRMLVGDGLAERWKEWQKDEMFRQEFNKTHKSDSIIFDSTRGEVELVHDGYVRGNHGHDVVPLDVERPDVGGKLEASTVGVRPQVGGVVVGDREAVTVYCG